MDLLQAVHTNTHIGKPQFLKLPSQRPIYKDPVGRNHGPKAETYPFVDQIQYVRPHKGFTPGEKNHRTAKPGQVLKKGHPLFGGEFIRMGRGIRGGVTMHTPKITSLGHIPDHHRPLIRRKLEEMGRQSLG